MRILFAAWLCMMSLPVFAGAASDKVQEIIQSEEEPAGVVFEIVTGNNEALEWALPQTQNYIEKLKQRFPDMPVAIVTHGREQFALQAIKQDDNQKVHSLTQQLVRDGVNLHVCGTYAGWKGLTEEDFPDYVNVSAAGPAQINDYTAVGYVKVVIKRPE